MASVLLVYHRRSDIARAFREVARGWHLSPAETAAIAGTTLPSVRPVSSRRLSDFVLERMTLAVEIDVLLCRLMERFEITEWLRRRIPGVLDRCPLDEMFGSSERLRGIRAMLEAEACQ